LFDKSVASNWLVAWHQDTALPLRSRIDHPNWGPWSVKGSVLHAIAPASALCQIIALRVHLDDSTHANGPLRVLPGSHTRGVLGSEEIKKLAGSVNAIECVTPAGGVVAMRPLTVHASSKAHGTSPRRVLHIEYAADINIDAGIELAVG
jgi:ectoine hydroxylase-related dioxygenase (phytanoyl-CoA dioxygenase family)